MKCLFYDSSLNNYKDRGQGMTCTCVAPSQVPKALRTTFSHSPIHADGGKADEVFSPRTQQRRM